jgi:hypothetical protein
MSRDSVTRGVHIDALRGRAELQRRELANEFDTVSAEVAKVDGWITIARRVTPALAAGVIAATVVAGPVRVGRWLRTAVVPVLLIRQLLSGRK